MPYKLSAELRAHSSDVRYPSPFYLILSLTSFTNLPFLFSLRLLRFYFGFLGSRRDIPNRCTYPIRFEG